MGLMPRLKPAQADVLIGTNIRSHRERLGVSQVALGNAIGVSFQEVQKYEDGKSPIAASRLIKVSVVLKVPLSKFLDGY
jgi:transcriptional regulator with XRE-family HTH domain